MPEPMFNLKAIRLTDMRINPRKQASPKATPELRLKGERASTCYTDMVESARGEILLVHDTSFEDSWRNGEMDVHMTRISVSPPR